MADRITKLQRWLDLIAYLVGRRMPVVVEELMERVPAYAEKWKSEDPKKMATARRTFERDKDELRKLGIPIRTVSYAINFGTEQVEGYRIDRKDFYLPYLRIAGRMARAPGGAPRLAEVELTDEEARTALEALRRVSDIPAFPLAKEARSAFRKLAFDLDPAAFGSDHPVLYVDRPGISEELDRLRQLSAALIARKRVRFRYHGMRRGEQTERDVAPWGLMFQQGHWYLVGHDETRGDVRVFRVGRMEAPVANTRSPNTPDYEIPPDFRLDAFANRAAWELGAPDEAPVQADVLFRFPASLWAERNGHGELIERREDGSCVRSFSIRQVRPFAQWLLGMEGDAVVLGPPALREAVRDLATAVVAAHERNGAGDG